MFSETSGPSLSGGLVSVGIAGSSGAGNSGEISTVGAGPVKLEDKERRSVGLQILRLLLDSRVCQPYLLGLLTARCILMKFDI